jgi:hypothetical protein
MQLLFGMIVGALLTIVLAFAYDSSTGRASNGMTSSSANAPMVNWDVVSHNWDGVKTELRNAAAEVERGWKRIWSAPLMVDSLQVWN